MPRRGPFWNLILSIALIAPLASQQAAPLRDPSPHQVRLVTVDAGVKLEVLDWGGKGRPLILLAGGGHTAHVFDDFAPELTADHHVIGITRRGFGASTYAAADGAERLGEDVVAVIHALKLKKPVLVGHSIAGAEMSAVANLHPESIAGVIFLDAAYPYAFDNGKGPSTQEFLEVQGPQAPVPGATDLANFSALQKWDARTYGFARPEAELRQTWDSTSDGRPDKPSNPPGAQVFTKIMTGKKKFATIPVPVLAIFAIPHVQEAWMKESRDPAVRSAADAYFARVDSIAERQAKALEDGVPQARVIRLKGMHNVFISNEADVLREIRAFLAQLK